MRRALAGCVLLALAATGARAQLNPATPPTTRTMDCTTSGCHAKQLDHTFLHGPTAVKACDACHEFKDEAKHTFELKRPGQQLCNFCHIDKTGREGPVVHEPVAKGECTACHDPHGSSNRKMLVKETTNQLCLGCHKETLKGAHAHKPAAENCTQCHSAHTASHAKLLIADGRDLCLTCHKDVGNTIATASHPHDPAKGDCLQCHSPHATDQIKALKASPQDLCISCHKDVGKTVLTSTHPHGAATDARACLNCHTPHGSGHEKQLLKNPVGACLECHKKPIVVDKTRTVAAVAEIANPALHKHGPIEKGDCAGCHGVHGASEPKLLVASYAPGFYQPFSDEAFALCFKCHDRKLAVTQSAQTETAFRDGPRNLHYVHVTKGPQGRSCRACHSAHASKFETMMAESVSYGQWTLPLNYSKTETGGSCSPGCHKVEAYDRKTPVRKWTPAPTGPTGPTPPPMPGAPAAPPAPAPSSTAPAAPTAKPSN